MAMVTKEVKTRVIRVAEQVYERLNELRLTRYGNRTFSWVLADMLEREEKKE